MWRPLSRGLVLQRLELGGGFAGVRRELGQFQAFRGSEFRVQGLGFRVQGLGVCYVLVFLELR